MRKLKRYKPTAFMASDSHYDKDAADYAVSFIEALSHQRLLGGKPSTLSTAGADRSGYSVSSNPTAIAVQYGVCDSKMGKASWPQPSPLLTCGDGERRVYGCAADPTGVHRVRSGSRHGADVGGAVPALSCWLPQAHDIPANQQLLPGAVGRSSRHGFNIHGVVFDELHTQPTGSC